MAKIGILALFLFMVFTVGIGVQAATNDTYSPSTYGFPESIAGYTAMAALTSDNTLCLPLGTKRLVLQSTIPDVETALRDTQPQVIQQAIKQVAQASAFNWEIQVIGPNVNKAQFLREIDSWNKQTLRLGCLKSGPVVSLSHNDVSVQKAETPSYLSGSSRFSTASLVDFQAFQVARSFGRLPTHLATIIGIPDRPVMTGTNGQESKIGSGQTGYALFEDLDAGNFSDDNAQSVNLLPVTVGTNQSQGGSRLLNNVRTIASSLYVLQAGFEFTNTSGGRVVWTDTTKGYANQPFGLTYDPTHVSYWFTITYTSNTWWMAVQDNSVPGSYTYVQEASGLGTTLILDWSTSVWAENQNTASTWTTGFSSPWQARGAKIYRNGVGQYWSTVHIHTLDACSTNWPPANALSGTFTGGGTGSFTIAGVPLLC